ncbi:MAG: PD-(D/E)XK nuclease family protein [Spirochaetales bacterium]|jgi:hypothetical protein|nr:PD-(D/E)XK nuclease family protein [Spirochaetales bacterium]
MKIYSARSWAESLSFQHIWLPMEEQVCVVVPEQANKFILKKVILSSRIFTLDELLGEHFLSRKDHEYISPNRSEMILGELLTSSPVKLFNTEVFKSGYLRALSDFIVEYRSHSLKPLAEAYVDYGITGLNSTEKDLISIYNSYENYLDKNNLYDYRKAAERCIDACKQKAGSLSGLQSRRLIFWGYDYLGELESLLVKSLIELNPGNRLVFCRNPEADDYSFRVNRSVRLLAESLSGSQTYLPGKADKLNREHGLDKPEGPGKSRQGGANESGPLLLAEGLFAMNHSADYTGGSNIAVYQYQAADRTREVIWLARNIRGLLDEGVEPQSIRIVCPEYRQYVSLIRETFPYYNIQFNFETGTPLVFYPLTNIVLQLVSHGSAANPFEARKKIFSSSYILYSHKVSVESLEQFYEDVKDVLPADFIVSPDCTEKGPVALDYALLSRLETEAFKTLSNTEAMTRKEILVRYILDKYKEQKCLNSRLEEALTQLFVLSRAEKSLYVWKAEMSADDFVKAIDTLLHRFIAGGIDEIDRAILKRINDLSRKMTEELQSKLYKPYPLSRLNRHFARLVKDSELADFPRKEEGVSVWPASVPLYKKTEVLFLCGLTDGAFPQKEPFNFLIPRSNQAKFTGAVSFIDRDRHFLYQQVAAVKKKIYVSLPLSDNGKQLQHSPFMDEFSDAGICEKKVERETLYSLQEKCVFASRNLDNDPELAIPVLREIKEYSSSFYEHLLAVYRSQGLRSRYGAFSVYDGIIDHPEALAGIITQLESISGFQVEDIERYAACPLRFFFDNILGLKPDYYQDYHPDSSDRGRFIRSVMQSLETERDPAVILERVNRQLAGADFMENNVFGNRFKRSLISGLKPDNKKQRKGLFASFLEYENTEPSLLKPLATGIIESVMIGDTPIKIAIDRVDVSETENISLAFAYSIADSGNVGSIFRGTGFKIPLMVLGLQKHHGSRSSGAPVKGAGIFLLKNRNTRRCSYFACSEIRTRKREDVSPGKPLFSGQNNGFLPEAAFRQEMEKVKQRITTIQHLMRKGRFNLPLCALRDRSCGNCYFKRICRMDQLRLDTMYYLVDENETYKPLRR